MKRLCFVVSSPMTALAFLRPHVQALSQDYLVTLVANDPSGQLNRVEGVERIHIPIERPIAPAADALAFASLVHLFLERSFDAVHSVTPKAGLLAMGAATLARVPHRHHTFTGQVWATRQALDRALLKQADRFLVRCITHALVDSPSQLAFLEQEGVITPGHATVLGAGSMCGVDPERFRPDPEVRARIREGLGIPSEAVVLLYLGRMHPDKGLLDLAHAFTHLAPEHPDAWLLLVGPDEGGLVPRVLEVCAPSGGRVRWVDFSNRPEGYFAAADICCLPSYREGFGTTLLEAAACGLPAVASRIYGITDAVAEGETGLLHPPGDTDALTRQLARLIRSGADRHALGDRARLRARSLFSEADLVSRMQAFYHLRVGT